MITNQNAKQSENLTIDYCSVEVVETFIYLGSFVGCNNDISQEINVET
jgi:hypothetical protein